MNNTIRTFRRFFVLGLILLAPFFVAQPFAQAQPVIDALDPSTVPPGGRYTITGSGFTPTGNDILWDGVVQLRKQSPTGTSIDDVAVPQGTALDDYAVTVRNSNGESNALTLTVISGPHPPQIDSLDPATVQPGGQYTITGSGFTPTENDILWDGVFQLRRQSPDGTSIDNVPVPQGTALGNYEVTVKNSNGESTALTLEVSDGPFPPQIDSLDPTTVQPGGQFTITGSGFTPTGNYIIPWVMDWPSPTGTSLDDVPVPQGTAPGNYPVTVQNSNGESNALALTVIPVDLLPQIDSLDPATVNPGAKYTITGSGFTPTGNDILWDGVFQLRKRSPDGTSIDNVPVPTDTALGNYEVTIENSNGDSNALTLTVIEGDPPQIDSLDPATVQPGARYTITGSGFTPTQNNIRWDGVGQLRKKSPTGTSIDDVPVPQGTALGNYEVTVQNSNGESNALTLTVGDEGGPLPQIDSLDPSTVQPGTRYTITGSGFTPTGNDILWDGVFQVRKKSPAGTSIDDVAVLQGTAPGNYEVTIENINGDSNALTLTVE